jgi:hypothetical protein
MVYFEKLKVGCMVQQHTEIYLRITRIDLSNPKTLVVDEGNEVKKMKGYP